MSNRRKWVTFSSENPKTVTILMVVICLILSLQIPRIKIDTDPENMLSEEEFVRVFHNRIKKEFNLYDMIVLGIVNEEDPDGVFNPVTLRNIYELTEKIERIEGVISIDLLAPSKVDDIQQAGLGAVRFEWLMASPPKSRKEATLIRDRARENPLLYGTLLSEDGKALCLYIPIREKNLSYQIASRIREMIRGLDGNDQYHITGLPVAEDTFGVEMFKQMAVSAPLAGIFIFILMWFFFRNVALVFSAMIVAIVTVLCTMGLLIGTGYTVHIMSSMIPIFLMPIAVVDSIHILSEFFDRYQDHKNRVETIRHVMGELFRPMLYTSLTSSAGFASLALTPIPPVRVFGLFVAFGIMLAWVLTITFIPAYIMFIKESSLERFGIVRQSTDIPTAMERLLSATGQWTRHHSKGIIVVSVLVLVVSVLGITRIMVNDNPVKWFEKDHPIRVADRVLNRHFGGTYMAYLVLEEKAELSRFVQFVKEIEADLDRQVEEVKSFVPSVVQAAAEVRSLLRKISAGYQERKDASILSFLETVEQRVESLVEKPGEETAEAWAELSLFLNIQKVEHQPFKKPEVLRYMETLEEQLLETGVVGKSNSLADIVKKVHYELMGGNKEFNVIPKTPAAVAQTLLSFQNSHDPDDLWHLVTPNYSRVTLWIQLKSGDNKDMEFVRDVVDGFFSSHSPPIPLEYRWAGLTYLNMVWQDKMVRGMIRSLMGSFVIVLIIVTVLFRSPVWGLLCMVPLTATITLIYGLIGFVGKDYDMPIAVLSAMTLGLSVDFAIHFLERSRTAYSRSGSNWELASKEMFGEPAKAISRNILVIAIGFTPLLIAPLIPYQTVGFFLASIMIISGIATLVILPALFRRLEPILFREKHAGTNLK